MTALPWRSRICGLGEAVDVALHRIEEIDAVALLLVEAAQVLGVFGLEPLAQRALGIAAREQRTRGGRVAGGVVLQAAEAAGVIGVGLARRGAVREDALGWRPAGRYDDVEVLPAVDDRAIVLVGDRNDRDERIGPQEVRALREQGGVGAGELCDAEATAGSCRA